MLFILLDIRTRIPLLFPSLSNMLCGPLYFPFYKESDGVLSVWIMDTEVTSMVSQTFRVGLDLNPGKMIILDTASYDE